MTKLAEVKSVTVSALRSLATKARSLADAIDMELAAATPMERSQLAVVSGMLRRHENSFKRYADNLSTGSLPPKRAATDMQWIVDLHNERIRHGKPVERRDADAFANRRKAPRKSGSLGEGV